MDIRIYTVLHVVGFVMALMGIGGLALHGMTRGAPDAAARKPALILHGVGLLLVLVSGFGQLAKLDIMGFPWPGWVWAKIAIWLLVGGLIAVARKKPDAGGALWWGMPVLVGLAAWLALFKPF